MSIIAASTSPQFAAGPQKWTVFGPTGLFKNALNADAIAGRQVKSGGQTSANDDDQVML